MTTATTTRRVAIYERVSSDEQRDALLRDLLSAAWGDLPAQNQ